MHIIGVNTAMTYLFVINGPCPFSAAKGVDEDEQFARPIDEGLDRSPYGRNKTISCSNGLKHQL